MTLLEETIEKARRLNIDELLILDKVIQEAKILHNTLWPKRIDLGKSFDKLKNLTFDDVDKMDWDLYPGNEAGAFDEQDNIELNKHLTQKALEDKIDNDLGGYYVR